MFGEGSAGQMATANRTRKREFLAENDAIVNTNAPDAIDMHRKPYFCGRLAMVLALGWCPEMATVLIAGQYPTTSTFLHWPRGFM